MENTSLSAEEKNRYSRQILITGIDISGQEKLKKAAVLIVGCGGLGSINAMYLAGAGIGRIGIIDDDRIALSNLNRQVSYDTTLIGEQKVAVLKKRVNDLNPGIIVDDYSFRYMPQNAEKITESYQIVIDGTDNLSTRSLINKICVKTRKPYIHGAVQQFFGEVAVFDCTKGACYNCVFPEFIDASQEKKSEGLGVLGPVAGIIGLIQTMEVIKLLLGIGNSLIDKMLLYDSLENKFQEVNLLKNAACNVCGSPP